MSLPRPLARLAVVVLAVLTAIVASAGLASAHVGVSSTDATPGGFGKVTFRVPNESDAASTVKIRIQIPTDPPLASVSVQPVPGWTAVTTTTRLDPPVTDDDGNEITEAVSVVEFTADAGSGCTLRDARGVSVGICTRSRTVEAVSLSFGTRKVSFP